MRKFISLLLTTILVYLLVPTMIFADSINYLKWDPDSKSLVTNTVTEFTVMNSSHTTLQDGFYIVNQDLTFDTRIEISGDVSIILINGFTLTCNEGIHVSGTNSLSIFGQSENEDEMGKLIASSTNRYNGVIGNNSSSTDAAPFDLGGKIRIDSGLIFIALSNTGDQPLIGSGIYGENNTISIEINGGIIETSVLNNSHYSSIIGGSDVSSGGSITINGGKINCDSSKTSLGAGIGGHMYNLTINGGDIVIISNGATSIGGDKITINGGNINAYSIGSNNVSPVIGTYIISGNFISKVFSEININGGNINVSNPWLETNNIDSIYWIKGPAIGAAYNFPSDGEYQCTTDEGIINITGGTIVAQGGQESPGIGSFGKISGLKINITGGNITSTGGKIGSGIGVNYDNAINVTTTTINISGNPTINSIEAKYGGCGIGITNNIEIDYLDINISGGTIISRGSLGAINPAPTFSSDYIPHISSTTDDSITSSTSWNYLEVADANTLTTSDTYYLIEEESFGSWETNGDGTHSRYCSLDSCSDSHFEGLENCTGGTATCIDKAICDICHSEYGDINSSNHVDVNHADALEPTYEREGHIEYWYCNDCDLMWSDEELITSITMEDIVIPQLEEPAVTPSTSPTPEPSTSPTPIPTSTPTPVPTTAPTTTPTPTAESGISGFVERLYTFALNRPSESGGKANWIRNLSSHIETGGAAARFFCLSEEMSNRNLNNEDYVEMLYNVFFDRASDPVGKSNWVTKLNAGASRESILDGFINSTEWANVCARYGIDSGGTALSNIDPTENVLDFVRRIYDKCLTRGSDAGGLDYWGREISNRRQSATNVAYGFFFSEEFINFNLGNEEYLERLYQTFMDRASDEGGRNYWLERLNSGTTREEVFYGFANSEEFTNICESYGIYN